MDEQCPNCHRQITEDQLRKCECGAWGCESCMGDDLCEDCESSEGDDLL